MEHYLQASITTNLLVNEKMFHIESLTLKYFDLIRFERKPRVWK